MPAGQRPVIVVKEEHPLQVRLRRRSRVPAVRRRIIRQVFHRHRPQGRTQSPANAGGVSQAATYETPVTEPHRLINQPNWRTTSERYDQLGLPVGDDDHRRVLAVIRYLSR